MKIDLNGKRALVLGASGGLGGAIARSLSEAGATVAAAGRSEEKLKASLDGVTIAHFLSVDLTQPNAGDTLADQALATLGGVDILVNNSGGPPPSSALGTKPEVWRAQFDAMVLSLITLTTRLMPGMKEARWGRILTVVSSGVVAPIPNLALSNALRSSLVGWSKTLAAEVAADGITANLLIPGRIATDRVAALDAAAAGRLGKSVAEVEQSALAAIPAGRYGKPEEFAAAATFLASDQASYITGTSIRIDGGMLRNI
jgi:3-oxoacyl-[acyl-carrier protein] reductase